MTVPAGHATRAEVEKGADAVSPLSRTVMYTSMSHSFDVILSNAALSVLQFRYLGWGGVGRPP